MVPQVCVESESDIEIFESNQKFGLIQLHSLLIHCKDHIFTKIMCKYSPDRHNQTQDKIKLIMHDLGDVPDIISIEKTEIIQKNDRKFISNSLRSFYERVESDISFSKYHEDLSALHVIKVHDSHTHLLGISPVLTLALRRLNKQADIVVFLYLIFRSLSKTIEQNPLHSVDIIFDCSLFNRQKYSKKKFEMFWNELKTIWDARIGTFINKLIIVNPSSEAVKLGQIFYYVMEQNNHSSSIMEIVNKMEIITPGGYSENNYLFKIQFFIIYLMPLIFFVFLNNMF